MAHITRDHVIKLARLSKIKLEDSEIDKFVTELSKIVEYANQIGSVDVRKLKPTDQVNEQVSVTREDEVVDYAMSQKDLLKNAPATSGGQIKVKRIIK